MKIKSISISIICFGLFFITKLCSAQETEAKEAKKELEQLTNLEDISFTMPENWIYQKNPGSLPVGFTAMAADPTRPYVTVTVWDYEVDTYKELIPLFKRDLKKLGDITEITVTMSDTLINGLTVQSGKKFKWIGKNYKNNGKMRLIAVGALESIYADNWETIKVIFNSIRED